MSAITKTAKTMAKVHNTFFIIHLILTAKLAHFFEISAVIAKKSLFQGDATGQPQCNRLHTVTQTFIGT